MTVAVRGRIAKEAVLGLLAAAGAALAVLPSKAWLTAFGSGGLVLAALALAYPPTLIYVVLLTSPFAGLLRRLEEIEVAGRTVSLSGLRWLAVALLLVVVLGVRRRGARIPRPMVPLLVFGGWAALRCAGAGADPRGLGDVLFYLLPPLLAIYADTVFQATPHLHAARVAWLIIYSVLIPVLLYAILIPLGEVSLTENGPKGMLGPRPVATYLVTALCVSLSWWRYGAEGTARRRALAVSLLAFGTIVFTASRMATVTAVLLFAVCWVNPLRWWRLLPRAAAGLALAAVVLVSVPQLRERLFWRAPATLEEAVRLVSWSGRDRMWLATFEHARLRPLIGWGPGTARPIVAAALDWEGRDVPPDEYPPHNEYLQVFHDTGLVGLLLLLVGWLGLLVHHFRGWCRAHAAGDRWMGRWFLASVLGIIAVLLNSLVDNTLHYTTVTGPLFVVLGCTACLRAARVAPWPSLAPPPEEGGVPEDAEPC
jgi:O-antigen ligase